MPEQRLQRTREAYRPLTNTQVMEALWAAPWLPYRLSCGCRRQHVNPEDPSAPDVFICELHQRMARKWLSDNNRPAWRALHENAAEQLKRHGTAYKITQAQLAHDKEPS